MESIWSKTCEIPRRHSLNHDVTTDVAIIGAGMAGILTAYHLQEQGIKTIVLDAERIAGGITKNTTAKSLPSILLSIVSLSKILEKNLLGSMHRRIQKQSDVIRKS